MPPDATRRPAARVDHESCTSAPGAAMAISAADTAVAATVAESARRSSAAGHRAPIGRASTRPETRGNGCGPADTATKSAKADAFFHPVDTRLPAAGEARSYRLRQCSGMTLSGPERRLSAG